MKVVRYAFSAIVALIVLAVVAIGIAIAVINPNDYKPQIEAAVEKQTNLDLILEGDIGWSFIPLGLELNQVQANLDGEQLVALDQMIAQINLWSLIKMAPRVNTFLLNGLDARLEVNEQGEGNWTRIMPEGVPSEEDTLAEATEAEAPAAGNGETLEFNVESVEIRNARVHYNDLSTGQSVTLENLNVSASNIMLDSAFPLDISFRVETAQPQFVVDGSLNARLQADRALNEFAVSGLNAVFDMSGEPFGSRSVTATMGGSLVANLEDETASLNDITATLANLNLNANLRVQGFNDQPALNGRVEIAEFSLKQLLSNLGQPALETEDPDALKRVALATDIGGEAGTAALSGLRITLDDTTFNGSGSYNLTNGAIVFDLRGDKLNADRYLPPASEEEAASEEPAPETASQPETDLLPLETLRELLLDIDFGLGELIISNLTIQDIKASTTAESGLLQVDEFSGKLYDGRFGATVVLNARTDNPSWRIRSDATNIQTLPLLTDLADMEMLSGGANLDIAVDTTGNRISALRENAKGQINFNLAEGQFRDMNLTRMACQGIAMVNQEQLTTSDWGTHTPFNDMRGTLNIDGNTLDNTNLVAALAGMRLEGNGTVDLAQSLLDYELGLRIVGEIHRDNACRVTEYVENVVIPMECRGNFSEDPAGLCSFDGSRFRDTLKDIAANAARARAREETERAKERAEQRAREEIEERLGEDGDRVRDAVRGLFNR